MSDIKIEIASLRIGNLLRMRLIDMRVQYGRVTSINGKWFSINGTYGNDCWEPVPITDSNLPFLGATLGSDACMYRLAPNFWLTKTPKGWLVSAVSFAKYIQYIHELQNIFYCITGQELPIKFI